MSTIHHRTNIFHFTAWPSDDNFGVCDSKNLLTFISLVRREIGKPTTDFTIAAHDSTGGVGGASTFIVMYQMLHDLDSNVQEVASGSEQQANRFLNLFDTVNELRKKRAHMIQTFSNYKFILSTLACYASNKSMFDDVLDEKNDKEGDDIFNYYSASDEDIHPESPIYVN